MVSALLVMLETAILVIMYTVKIYFYCVMLYTMAIDDYNNETKVNTE